MHQNPSSFLSVNPYLTKNRPIKSNNLKTSLSDVFEEFDDVQNQRLLKSLHDADSDLQYPVVVRFGDRNKQEFSITKLIKMDSNSISYEAFRKAGDFITTIPVIIKTYRRGVRKHPIQNFKDDVDSLKRNLKRITLDADHLLVAFNDDLSPVDNYEENYAMEVDDDVNEYLLSGLNDPNWNELPYAIYLGPKKEDQYVLQKYVARGYQGIVYEGYRTADPLKKPVIIKSYIRRPGFLEVFRNEEFALEQQSRLIHSDSNHMIIVQVKIEGDTLGNVISSLILNNTFYECERILDRYLLLPQTFREQFGLVHNDAHPDNVIVDGDNAFHLIDFGKTVPLSDNERELAIQADNDDSVVKVWYDIFKTIIMSRKQSES